MPIPAHWRRALLQDLVWLALFVALGWASLPHTSAVLEVLILFAAFQMAEPWFGWLTTPLGRTLSILAKLLLGYLLIGVTGGIASSFFLILLLPVVSAATTLRLWHTLIFTLLACAIYFSFFFYLNPNQYIDPTGYHELGLRMIFLVTIAFLTHGLAEANRNEASRAQATASQLALANQNLQAAEEEVRRADRLAALGQLSAGLAHELRNPLGTIRASAEMLTKEVATATPLAQELAGFIASEVDRTNSLVTRFLDFARPLRVRLQRTDLVPVLDRSVAELDRLQLPVSVHKNYAPELWPLPLDAELIERVIFNLLLNAAQATTPGGTITLKARPIPQGVEVAVIDRGHGISPAHQQQIFNPFFTTKPEGVGLGLPIVAKIVDEHGGTITVESAVHEGSQFRVFLPREGPPV